MTTSETNFSYRPISSLAIIAFAGGLIASISVITSWLLAALSIAFSLFALRSIYAADPRPAGTILAMIGFLLSIFWLCFSVTAYWTHRNQVLTEAAEVGKIWCTYLTNNKRNHAHQLTYDYSLRVQHSTPVNHFYSTNPHARKSRDKFYKKIKGVEFFTDPVELDRILEFVTTANKSIVVLQYKIGHKKTHHPVLLKLILIRNYQSVRKHGKRSWYWQVQNVVLAKDSVHHTH